MCLSKAHDIYAGTIKHTKLELKAVSLINDYTYPAYVVTCHLSSCNMILHTKSLSCECHIGAIERIDLHVIMCECDVKMNNKIEIVLLICFIQTLYPVINFLFFLLARKYFSECFSTHKLMVYNLILN